MVLNDSIKVQSAGQGSLILIDYIKNLILDRKYILFYLEKRKRRNI